MKIKSEPACPFDDTQIDVITMAVAQLEQHMTLCNARLLIDGLMAMELQRRSGIDTGAADLISATAWIVQCDRHVLQAVWNKRTGKEDE